MKSSSTIIINNDDATYKLSNIYKNMNFSNIFGQENKSSSINFNVNKFQNNLNNNISNSNSTKMPVSINNNNNNKSINFNNTITNSQQLLNQHDYNQTSKFSNYNNNIRENNKPSSAIKDNKTSTYYNKYELKKKEVESKETFSLSQNKNRELSASFNKVNKQINNPGNTINASSNFNNVNSSSGLSISNSQAKQFINKPGKVYTLSHNKGSVIKPVNNMRLNNQNLNCINNYSNSKQQNDNSKSQNKNQSLSSNFQSVFNPTFSSSTLLSRTANKAKDSITSKSAIFRSSARNINISETNPTFSNNFSNSNNSTTLSGIKQNSNIINSRVNSNFQIQSNDPNNLDILTEEAYSNTFYLNKPSNLLSKLSEKPLFKDSIKIDSEGNNIQSTINLNTSNSNQLSTFNNISHSKNSNILKTPEGQFKYNDTNITSLQYVKFEEDKLNTVTSPFNENKIRTNNVNINDKVNLLRARFEDLQSQLNDFRHENLRVKKLMEAIN